MTRTESIERARREIPILRANLDQLIELGPELLSQDLSRHNSPHFSFLIFNLTCKQLTHALSLRALVDQGHDRDSTLIARAMAECMAIALWAARDPEPRALLWRTHALVHDYNLLQQKKARGEPIEPEEDTRIVTRALNDGAIFLTKTARRALEHSSPLPSQPFQSKWHLAPDGSPISVRALFLEVDEAGLYSHYEAFSDWAHSNGAGLGTAVVKEGITHSYRRSWPPSAAAALLVGCATLTNSIDSVCRVYSLDDRGRVSALSKELRVNLNRS